MRKRKNKILIIGIILIYVGLSILVYKCFNDYMTIESDNKKVAEFMEKQKQPFYSKLKKENPENTVDPIEENTKQAISMQEFIAVLEIPKISLKKGLYSIGSLENDVSKNIKILEQSDMPDKINGNFILAGHSGTGRIAYFKNLNSLLINDEIYTYYQGKKYSYKVTDKYDIQKTGKLNIKNHFGKQVLTLITCHHKTNKQLIIIAELIKEENL